MAFQSTGLSDDEGVALVVKPKIAWKMLGCSNTRGYELLNAGELESFLDGHSRKITVASIRTYIARRLASAVGPAKDNEVHQQRGRRRKAPHAAGEHLRHET